MPQFAFAILQDLLWHLNYSRDKPIVITNIWLLPKRRKLQLRFWTVGRETVGRVKLIREAAILHCTQLLDRFRGLVWGSVV